MRDCKAVIEFGTSKITCTIAEQKQRMGLEVLGCAKIPYAGIKNSNWVDSDRVYAALDEALAAAEHQADIRLRHAHVGIPGSFLRIVNKTAQVKTAGRVTENDITHLVQKASDFAVDSDLALLEAAPAWFLLDDGNVYLDAEGVSSAYVRGSVSYIFANRFFLNDVSDLLQHLSVHVESFIPEPLAEALYLIPQDKRDDLAVLVDIGYSTTGVSVVYGDAILFFENIPLGGANIAGDLSYVMKVDLETAERLKRRYSFGLAPGTGNPHMFVKDSAGKLRKYPHEIVNGVVDARVEQIVKAVSQIVFKAERDLKRKLDVFLTGGGISFMRGSSGFFKSVSGKTPVPISVTGITLSDPSLHAAYAMLQYAYSDMGIQPKLRKKSFFGKQESAY